MTVKEGLQKALELLDDGRNWEPRKPMPSSIKHCAFTACCKIEPPSGRFSLVHALYKFIPGNESLGSWNDRHTYKDIKSLFERAIAAAE